VADEETVIAEAVTPTPPAWFALVRQPLSTVQTVVGILAGLLTIGGGFLSFTGLASSATPPPQGEIVAVVQDLRSSKPLSHATVEIFTPQDAIVTATNVEPDGHLTRRLKEGRYRLRVTHPGFLTEVRHVEIHSGQRSDVRIALGPRPQPRVVKAAPAEPGPVAKFFREVFGQ
jgi:hypothetical protein